MVPGGRSAPALDGSPQSRVDAGAKRKPRPRALPRQRSRCRKRVGRRQACCWAFVLAMVLLTVRSQRRLDLSTLLRNKLLGLPGRDAAPADHILSESEVQRALLNTKFEAAMASPLHEELAPYTMMRDYSCSMCASVYAQPADATTGRGGAARKPLTSSDSAAGFTQPNGSRTAGKSAAGKPAAPPPRTKHAPLKAIVLVLPYRDRERNLDLFLRRIARYASDRPGERWIVYRIEQNDQQLFNKGWLFNAGFDAFAADEPLLANSTAVCVVEHDIDMLPEPGVEYNWCQQPIQLASEIECSSRVYKSAHAYSLPYLNSGGAVVSMTPQHWRLVNGWAPECGGRFRFPPPEKNELVLSIETGCTDTVSFSTKTKHPVLTRPIPYR